MSRPEPQEVLTEQWALRRAEQLLEGLTGVMSAKIVTAPGGEIEEIHVLTRHDVAPKQMVRNVESALLAHLGIKVDHRKISIAQTKAPGPEAREAAPLAAVVVAGRKYLYQGFEIEKKIRDRILCRVRLKGEDGEIVGEAEGADVPRVRMETTARALLDALEKAEEHRVSLALDAARVVHAFERDVIVVGVYATRGRTRTFLTGASPLVESSEQAAILATLHATNRWITQP